MQYFSKQQASVLNDLVHQHRGSMAAKDWCKIHANTMSALIARDMASIKVANAQVKLVATKFAKTTLILHEEMQTLKLEYRKELKKVMKEKHKLRRKSNGRAR